MPADLPAAVPVATIPYYRAIAFVAGGGVTLGVLMLLTNLMSHLLV